MQSSRYHITALLSRVYSNLRATTSANTSLKQFTTTGVPEIRQLPMPITRPEFGELQTRESSG
jgi:hypothetical protein